MRLSRESLLNRRSDGGMAMLLVLGVLFAVCLFTSAYFILLNRNADMAGLESRRLEAFNLAEAGIHLAVTRLSNDGAYTGESGVAIGNGLVDIAVEQVSDVDYSIHSAAFVTGRSMRRQAEVLANTRKTQTGWRIQRWEEVR